jgi:hypothetical protein
MLKVQVDDLISCHMVGYSKQFVAKLYHLIFIRK